jgi:hypothetical protein
MLLFGAGASIEAKVPGAYKMTEAIAERFRQNRFLIFPLFPSHMPNPW